MVTEFRNEPLTDFTQEANRSAQLEALRRVRSRLGREYDLIIGGRRVQSRKRFNSINPSDRSEIIGTFQGASAERAAEAMEAATRAFGSWKRFSAEHRADLLLGVARILRERRLEMNAWMMLEVGKTWGEADADTAEAIDFCEFYAREALRYAEPQPLVPLAGETNELRYLPLGAGGVIAPWNFPCAIALGMTAAAFVAGNTVVLKPSSDSPAVAAFLMEILEEAGVPPGVVNFVTGGGGEAGEGIIASARTRFVAFTGSKETGLHIVEEAARPRPGQIWIKRVIAEMGGKDFILVDGDADLDAALEGVVASAFGYQGQKCSACSRLILHERVYPEFLERLIERTAKLRVGPATDPASALGPVINEGAMKRILGYVEKGRTEGRLVAGGGAGDPSGYFVQPTVIADVPPTATIAREEIFGPVLAVLRAKSFDEGVAIANDSEYGLTGAVYGSNQGHLERAKAECHVGNLYLNRKCTGAMVGVHPFGGFNLSGTNSKAGGRDYLMHFTQAKVISEKTFVTG